MDDAISRQAVLKLLSTIPAEEAITKAMLIQSVKQMDAAQPSGPDNLVKDSQGLVKELVNDCISRKAAIDEVINLWADKPFGNPALVEIKDCIEKLPSAQPEKRTEERTETHACDLIDREAAVDAIYHHLPSVSRTRARTMLHEVPSAQPEIIRCKDCKWYGRADKRRFYRGTDCLNHRIDTIVPDKDYCSRAERRTDG